MTKPIVLFAFYGRRANVEMQLPFIHRILDENPDVTFEAWSFCRTPEDDAYLHTLDGERERMIIRHNVWHRRQGWRGMACSYQHYTQRAFMATTFVKMDDDVVFLETDRFGEFLDAIRANPGHVVSADVVNNGACSQLDPALRNLHRDMDIPLLDVHLSPEWGAAVHDHAIGNFDDYLGRPTQLVPTEDWLSINCIGYTYPIGLKLARSGVARSPAHIAGRDFNPKHAIGDEGICNTLPRMVMKGFAAVHITFGPQDQQWTDEQKALWRKGYRELGEKYLR